MSKEAPIDAITSLATDLLPRLAEQLATILGGTQETPAPDLLEAYTMTRSKLDELCAWMGVSTAVPGAEATATIPIAAPTDGPMGDEEAHRLLAEMDGESSPAPVVAATAPAPGGSMSDEEARRLLDEMDTPTAASDAAPAVITAAPAAAEGHGHVAAEHGADGKEIKEEPEIDEWRPSEFQSDQTLIADFVTTSGELMESLDDLVLQLEQNPTNKETIESIFRSAHTIKGTAAMFGFAAVERVMHRMENLFDLIRKDKIVPNSEIIDVVFQGLDILRTLLEAVGAGKPCGVKTASVVHALTLVAAGKKSSLSGRSSKKDEASPEASPETKAAVSEGGGGDGKVASAKKAENSTIRVDLERLDVLVNLVGELVIDRTRFASIDEELRTKHPQLKLSNNLTETVQLFSRHMNDVQDIIMKVRMVPTRHPSTSLGSHVI